MLYFFIVRTTFGRKSVFKFIPSFCLIDSDTLNLHWILDIAFREDESRIRKDHGPENFAILRHIALNPLKQDTFVKAGIKAKRLKAGWDRNCLLKLLSELFKQDAIALEDKHSFLDNPN